MVTLWRWATTGDYCHGGRAVRVNEWGRLVVDGVGSGGDDDDAEEGPVAGQRRHDGGDGGGDGGGGGGGDGGGDGG